MQEVQLIESGLVTVGTATTLIIPTTWARCFVGVKLVNDSDAPVLGTSGSFTVEAYGPCSDAAQAVLGSPIVVPANAVLSFAMNANKLVVTPTSIVGASKYKVVVISNKS
jgi:hypothetical protein